MVALGRTHLRDPQWTLHAAADQDYRGEGADWVAPFRAGSRKPRPPAPTPSARGCRWCAMHAPATGSRSTAAGSRSARRPERWPRDRHRRRHRDEHRDVDDYQRNGREIGRRWREMAGTEYPAMAGIGVTRLWQREAMIEIQGVAHLPAAASDV